MQDGEVGDKPSVAGEMNRMTPPCMNEHSVEDLNLWRSSARSCVFVWM